MTENSTHTNVMLQLGQAGRLTITVIFGTIILVGCVGNVLVICLIVLVRKLHSTVNICLGCLAVTDLMVLVFVPIMTWHMIYDMDYSSLGLNFCIFLNSLDKGAMVCSALIFLLVGVERYTVLCHPLKSLGWWTRQKVCLLLVVIFVVSVGVCVPYGLAGRYEEEISYGNITEIICYLDWDIAWMEPLETIVISVFFFFLIPVLLLLNGKMIIALKTKVPHDDSQETGARGISKSRAQVVIMVVVVMDVFLLCLTPFRVYLFVVMYAIDAIVSLEEKSLWALMWCLRIIQYINYASNPIFYFLMSDNFRQAFKEVFCRRCKPLNKPRLVHTISSSL